MKIKKVISGITAVLVLAGAVPVFSANPVQDYAVTASAADYTEGTYESLTYKKYSDYIEITDCDKSATEVVIPAKIRGLPVTGIGYEAFYSCKSLTAITIPDSVTSIDGWAFFGTPWLEAKQKENPFVVVNGILIDGTTCKGDVIIPDGITSIGKYAFFGCKGLTSITISDSVTIINESAFDSCYSLTEITIPDSVTSIGDWAFRECKSLTSITIPDSITSISDYAFYDCSGLTSITIPDSVTSIGDYAFDGCSSLESITIPDGVTIIGSDAFRNCSSLTSITIPDGVTIIDYYMFTSCKSLTSIAIPDSVIHIGDATFEGCSSLESITIPDSVTFIGKYAFRYCSSLTSITIPESVTNIYYLTFYGCLGLESITILNPNCEIDDSLRTICNGYNDENEKYYFNGTIRGYSGSTAQAYAEKYGYNFEAIDGEIENPEILLGDANCDGEISVADATLILQYCGNKDKYKLTEQGIINADVDGTAGISPVDALIIQQYDAGIIDKL